MKTQRVMRAILGALLLVGMCVPTITPLPADAQAQTGTATVVGTIVDQNSSLPVANANAELVRDNSVVATGKTDANGQVVFKNQVPGVYHISLSATGYEPGQTDDVVALAGQTTTVRTVLLRTTANTAGGLREIASVTSTRSALQTSSVTTQHIAAEKIQQEALLRVSDALTALPGITANDLDSAPGDDLHLNIRGLRGSETATLIDGHPVGPIGVYSGNRGGYNYQLSPSWGLNNVQVAYGSGGLSLYGTDTLAGAIDMQTLEPTTTPQYNFTQGIGTQGRLTSILQATGTAGRWGYAFVTGTQGTWGGFKPGVVEQSGNLAGDISPGNVAANTWVEAGNYILRSSLAKLRYQLSPGATATFTAYNATSWDDKTGNGDNDFFTPEFVGFSFDQAGTSPGCPPNEQSVVVDNSGTTQCWTRSQYVDAFHGPAGGSAITWQSQQNQDYSLRVSAHRGNNNANAQVWMDNFNLVYDRNGTGIVGHDSTHNYNYQSFGEELSDDILSENNDFGFGVYGFGQTEVDKFLAKGVFSQNPTLNESSMNYFIRDQYSPTSRLTFFGTAWYKTDSVTKQSYFNPRGTLVVRPTTHDVVRFSVGRADGTPNISLLTGPPQFNNTPASLVGNISCSGLTSVGSATNANLQAEKEVDEEISVGHQFGGDSNIQVVAYDMNETNVIFSNVIPLSTAGVTPPFDLYNSANGYLYYINQACHNNPTLANLGVTSNANAGTGRYRGFDISGRIRASRHFYADYSYDVLSARTFNIPQLAQQNNVLLIDGGQIDRVPIHTASLGVDFSQGGFETRIDGYYVGINNGLLRPAYTYANASISQRVRNVTFNLGVYNLFNSQYDQFGRIGYATFQPENQYGTDTNALMQAYNGNDGERFGLPQRSFLFSVTFHT